MIKKMLMTSFVVALLPLAALAQGLSSPNHRDWEVSMFGGSSTMSDRVFSTPVTGASQPTTRAVGLKYASGSQLGLRVAENRWKHWGAVAEYSFSNQPLRLSNLTDSQPLLALGHAIHRFSYNVAYYPLDRTHRFRPFAFAGPGVSLFYVRSDAKDLAAARGLRLNDPWKLTIQWGGGIKILLKDKVAASFQFSDNIAGVPHYGLPPNGRLVSGTYSAGFLPNGIMHNRLLSVGLIYQWGAR